MIKILPNLLLNGESSSQLKYFERSTTNKVREFHSTLPRFSETPLRELKQSADEFGIDKLWVKDESYRLGLKAFKVLGASYAITNLLYEKLKLDKTDFSFEKIQNEDLSHFTFVTATDGNHGRGVAWIANKLGCKSYVFIPNTSSAPRINNIEVFATEVIIVDGNYDFATEEARKFAEKNNAILIQDSSWEGYKEIPLKIMQGYLSLIDEIIEQIGNNSITHIFLHCGVGSMPAALEAYLVNHFGKNKPKTIIVEPHKANCFYHSIKMNDGKPHSVFGQLDSIMAGLSCGTPSDIAWDIISKHSDYFISCNDEIAKIGMRELAKFNIVSGESGAVSYGILKYAFENDRSIFDKLEIDDKSKIMLISTEGDTDQIFYKQVLSEND